MGNRVGDMGWGWGDEDGGMRMGNGLLKGG